MLSNRVLLQQLRKKVEDAEHDGVSPSLTRSTVNIKTTVATSSPIEKSLEFGEMCKALNHAPKDYKPPSADRAITSLLDDCKREIEKECAPVKDTWVTQGTSIVSDGWTNVKHKALMNVIASNKCREALATTIVVRAWKDWVNSGDERTKELGKEVAATITDDEFWDEVDNILAITKPIYLMIKLADWEGQKMGELYEKMYCMIGEINDVMKNNKHHADKEKMNEILLSRWEKLNIPMHCLGFALNPFIYDTNYLQSPAPGGVPRRAPNYDREVVQAKVDAVTMSPISWWSTYGAETPELAEIAVKVLSQPITSSSAERVWSTYSYIHNIKRNRLNYLRADKFVFIHTNIRLISRFTASYKDGPYRKWDVKPEATYLDDSTTRLEDSRWREGLDSLEGGDDDANKIPESKRQRFPDS
uniref:HAT C-terminal dimerisation domain-containing protein n=1 Tax=Chenopodium quinoa TaxID=63459 RepID=A0A803N8U3_CHEQI